MKWKMMPANFPTDGATVWVKQTDLRAPFQAVWHAATGEFEWAATYLIPWFVLSSWRNL